MKALRLIGLWILGCLPVVAHAAPAASQPATREGPRLRVLFVDANGKKIDKSAIHEFICRDLADEPVIATAHTVDGVGAIYLPDRPVQISARLNVPGFGEVVIYADNGGKGYTSAGTINFITDAVTTRKQRVQAALKQAKVEGVRMPSSFDRKLAEAEKDRPYLALATWLAAGEELTLARARHRIEQYREPRKGFLFGCNAFGHPARGAAYDQRFRELFNYGTTNLYLTHYAPTETTRDFSRTDAETEWLGSMGMTVKPCPPIYLAKSVTPEWMKNRPYSEVRRICHDLMVEVSKRYAGKAPFTEIVNEAHDFSNALGLSQDELVDLADTCSKAAREGDPKIQRIINCCHLWGDYAARPDKEGRARRSPYHYLTDCIKAGVQFEIVGLQMYYPEYDLMEIDRMLERYAKLGKTIHITEMGCACAPGIDPNAQRKAAAAGWHGDWTEDMQADWITSVYTIYYSKPYITAVSWWDLADAVSFWPYGGMLRGDLSPKPSYTRLKALLKTWGFSRDGK